MDNEEKFQKELNYKIYGKYTSDKELERDKLIKELTLTSLNKQSKDSLVTMEAIQNYYECLENDELIELHERISNV